MPNRKPPSDTDLVSIEAEQAVLGAVLLGASIPPEVRATINPQDFFWLAHQEIYKAMLAVADKNRPIDNLGLTEELSLRGIIDDIGYGDVTGSPYLILLLTMTPSYLMADHYAAVIHRFAMRRRLIDMSGEMARKAFSSDDPSDTITEALSTLTTMGEMVKGRMTSMPDAVDEFQVRAAEWIEHPRKVFGIPTGLSDLDVMTGGLEKSEYVLVAGRPSVGKSALALQIARQMAKAGHGVAYFSLEMNLLRIMLRLACQEARVDSDALRRGLMTPIQTGRFWEALSAIYRLPLWLYCQPAVTVAEVANEVAKLRASKPLDVVIVDYIQLMSGWGENENTRLTTISQGLAKIAKANDIVLIALAQLSRGIELRDDPQPKLADLRGSGALEQDADKVLFLWQYADEEEQGGSAEAALARKKKPRPAPMCIAKNRDGISGVTMDEFLFWGMYETFLPKADYDADPF